MHDDLAESCQLLPNLLEVEHLQFRWYLLLLLLLLLPSLLLLLFLFLLLLLLLCPLGRLPKLADLLMQ